MSGFELGGILGDLLGGGPRKRAEAEYWPQYGKVATAMEQMEQAKLARSRNINRDSLPTSMRAYYGDATDFLSNVLLANDNVTLGSLGELARPGAVQARLTQRDALLGDVVDPALANRANAFASGKDYQPTRIVGDTMMADGGGLGDAVMTPGAFARATKLQTAEDGSLYAIRPDATGQAVAFDSQGHAMAPDGSFASVGGAPSRATQPAATGGARTLLDEALAGAVEWAESRGNPNAVSPVGARGLMQLMPGTARELERELGMPPGETDRNPEANRRAGQHYLQRQLTKYGDPRLALAAYNWGPGNVDRALARAGGNVDAVLASAPAETRAYVPKVLGRAGSLGDVAPPRGAGPRFGKVGGDQESYTAPQEVIDPATGQPVLVRFGNRGGQQRVQGYAPKPSAKTPAADKPLPAALVKVDLEIEDALAAGAAASNTMAKHLNRIAGGEVDVSNAAAVTGAFRRFFDSGNTQDANLVELKADVTKMVNESLRLNKGVQTEGDAERARQEVMDARDTVTMTRALARMVEINQRGIALQKRKRELLYRNAGRTPPVPEGAAAADGGWKIRRK